MTGFNVSQINEFNLWLVLMCHKLTKLIYDWF